MSLKFNLGDRVKDRVTGFAGVVVGRADHISGCDTYGVQPEQLKDGIPQDARWLDEPRLVLVKAGVIKPVDEREYRTGADSTPQATR